MKAVKIKANYPVSYIQYLALLPVIIVFFILPFFGLFDTQLVIRVIWHVGFGIIALLLIFLFLLNCQTAVLSETGIVLRCKIFVMKRIKWAEVDKITLSRNTIGKLGNVKAFIEILTNDMQSKMENASKDIGGMYIRHSEENAKIIKSYCFKFNRNIDIKL